MVGIGILYLLILNGTAWLVLKVMGTPKEIFSDPHAIYPGVVWAPELLRELDRLDVDWDSYCYWRTAPFSGEYVNVDQDGLRRTWSDGHRVSNEREYKIFVFGGSAMWGFDARDDYTIASLLAKDLSQAGLKNVRVVNYGELGYVSTQELIAFLLALRQGERPDLVIFYDGFNDTVSAYRQDSAGIPPNEGNRTHEFNILNRTMSDRRHALYLNATATAIIASPLGTLLRRIVHPYGPWLRVRTASKGRRSTEIDAQLSKRVVEFYLDNMRLVQGVVANLGVPALIYTQPVLPIKNPLSAHESDLFGEMEKRVPGEPEFVHEVYNDLASTVSAPGYAGPRVTDLSAALNGPHSCFADEVHLTEECNAIVASRIALDAISALHDKVAREALMVPTRAN